MKKTYLFFAACFGLTSFMSQATPNIETVFDKNNEQFARAKVINKTNRELACYLAIDGYKIRFRLPAFQHSQWYKATDRRFNHKDFSTWCDYIEQHPEFKKYKVRL